LSKKVKDFANYVIDMSVFNVDVCGFSSSTIAVASICISIENNKDYPNSNEILQELKKYVTNLESCVEFLVLAILNKNEKLIQVGKKWGIN